MDVYNEIHEALGPRLNDRLTSFLEPFLRNAQFVRQLADECASAYVSLSFPGQFHFGFTIAPSTLQAIANLGLELGIEIFPDSAT